MIPCTVMQSEAFITSLAIKNLIFYQYMLSISIWSHFHSYSTFGEGEAHVESRNRCSRNSIWQSVPRIIPWTFCSLCQALFFIYLFYCYDSQIVNTGTPSLVCRPLNPWTVFSWTRVFERYIFPGPSTQGRQDVRPSRGVVSQPRLVLAFCFQNANRGTLLLYPPSSLCTIFLNEKWNTTRICHSQLRTVSYSRACWKGKASPYPPTAFTLTSAGLHI